MDAGQAFCSSSFRRKNGTPSLDFSDNQPSKGPVIRALRPTTSTTLTSVLVGILVRISSFAGGIIFSLIHKIQKETQSNADGGPKSELSLTN